MNIKEQALRDASVDNVFMIFAVGSVVNFSLFIYSLLNGFIFAGGFSSLATIYGLFWCYNRYYDIVEQLSADEDL